MSSIRETFQREAVLSYVSDENVTSGSVRAVRTDVQLIELTLSGDETAFEQIFDRHKKLVARTAARFFQRHEQIEEVIQISFAKAFVELGKFRGDHEFSLPSWLGRITSNVCLDQIRSRKRKPEHLHCELADGETATLIDIAADSTASAEDLIANRDLASKLLARLSEVDRALMHMFYVEEMTAAEIGDALGWSISKVKIRSWRARNSLRKILGAYL